VTTGLVASAERRVRGPHGRRIEGVIEHTAPLPRGSSGGPLVDASGTLLGLNAIREGGGLILAVPAERSRVDRLLRGDAPQGVKLGVAIAPARAARRMRSAVGLPERDGLLVRGVARTARPPGRRRARRPARQGRRRRPDRARGPAPRARRPGGRRHARAHAGPRRRRAHRGGDVLMTTAARADAYGRVMQTLRDIGPEQAAAPRAGARSARPPTSSSSPRTFSATRPPPSASVGIQDLDHRLVEADRWSASAPRSCSATSSPAGRLLAGPGLLTPRRAPGPTRLGALGLPLRLGEVADRHALGAWDLGRVAQVPLRVQRRLAARARGGDRLAVRVVDEVAGREDAGLPVRVERPSTMT
jgi:hypothetical protein